MHVTTFLTYVVVGLICFVFGVVMMRRKKDGTIKINTTDPDKDVYSIVLDIPLEDVPRKKVIQLDVEIS